MTDIQKVQISQRRSQGQSYGKIAEALGLPKSTVKSFCRRAVLAETDVVDVKVAGHEEPIQESTQEEPKPLSGTMDGTVCRCCGEPLLQIPGRRRKYFCSKECRVKWWARHPEASKGTAHYSFTCPGCGIAFTAYGNKSRKYCSHSCYIKTRFGGKANG